MSWYALLAGMGLFLDDLPPATAHQARHRLDTVDDFVARSALNFPDHRALLANIPPRVGDKTLQLYLW